MRGTNIDILHADVFLAAGSRGSSLWGNAFFVLQGLRMKSYCATSTIISWIKGMNMFATRDCTLKSLKSNNSTQV